MSRAITQVEAIALLAGYNQTATTELVYRHQIVPALTRGAEVMDQIFSQQIRSVTKLGGPQPGARQRRRSRLTGEPVECGEVRLPGLG
jgi:hypothetical protein